MKKLVLVFKNIVLMLCILVSNQSGNCQSPEYYLKEHEVGKDRLIFSEDENSYAPYAYKTKKGIIVSDDKYFKRIFNIGDGSDLKWWKYSTTNGQKFPFHKFHQQYSPYNYKLLVDMDTVLTINQYIFWDEEAEKYNGYIDIQKKNLEGDSIAHENYNEFDQNFSRVSYIMEDAIVFGDHYVISGICLSPIYNEDFVGFLLWMKKDGSRDTTIFIRDDHYNKANRLQITPEGNLAVLSEHSFKGANGIRSFYQKVSEYNANKKLVWEVKSHHYNRSNHLNNIDFVFLKNGNVVIKTFDSLDVFVPVLTCYDPKGAKVWKYTFKKEHQSRNFNRIIETSDGNIVLAGSFHDYSPSQRINYASYLCKINTSNGDIIWERIFPWLKQTYVDVQETKPLSKIAINQLTDLIELDNGDLFAPVFGGKFAFLKTDKDGCIEPGCGLYQVWDKPK